MKKGEITTDKVSLSIDKETNKRLNDYCESTLINKSKLVSSIIDTFLDKKEEKLKTLL